MELQIMNSIGRRMTKENVMNISSTLCACKGTRSCKICEGRNSEQVKKFNVPLPECAKIFYFDSRTNSARTEKNENSAVQEFKFHGVEIVKDFVSETEEKFLFESMSLAQWKPSQSGRWKQDYGPKANFKRKKVKMGNFTGLPKYFQFVCDRLRDIENLKTFETVELCNLHYSPDRGSAIDPHFDDFWLWGERLLTLNLLSDTWLTMTCGDSETKVVIMDADGNKSCLNSNEIFVKIPLNQRTLVILSGDARYKWKHQILRNDIKNERICCTLRELSKEFLTGERKFEGQELLSIASSFKGTTSS